MASKRAALAVDGAIGIAFAERAFGFAHGLTGVVEIRPSRP